MTGMKVRIHRGAKEVGGNCVEVEAAGARIVLDIGRPLGAGRDDVIPLPNVAGFGTADDSLLGVIISHGHQDHWGLIGQVPQRVPVYIGEAANRILQAAAFFDVGIKLQPTGFLGHRKTFELGPFVITPFLNDHSAFDTYSLLVEAEGKRLFYSADLQAHGRKSSRFEAFLRNPPQRVDVLLLEGTNLRADGDPKRGLTERELEEQLVRVIKDAQGIVLAMYPAQNIDRLVTWFRACLKSRRTLVLDLYGATVAEATGNKKIPQYGFRKLLIYVAQRQRIRVKEADQIPRVKRIRPSRIFPEDLAPRAKELVLTFRESMIREIERAGCLTGATVVYSQWPGYLEPPGSKQLRAFVKRHDLRLIKLHASGHAYVEDLQRLTEALAATRIVPIHSWAPNRFTEFFDGVELHDDGEWWEV